MNAWQDSVRFTLNVFQIKIICQDSGLTALFECLLGTLQACMISPRLFILYIDELINMLAAFGTPGIFVNDSVSSLHMIMYADDICIYMIMYADDIKFLLRKA